uniref:Uncharacterized protein n=1 Tax=Arundo donax TaxID=35708 RepID=A0A0A9GVL0_ARUDO
MQFLLKTCLFLNASFIASRKSNSPNLTCCACFCS